LNLRRYVMFPELRFRLLRGLTAAAPPTCRVRGHHPHGAAGPTTVALVTPLDLPAHDRWSTTADEHLTVARRLADDGFHAHAVLVAEQAAQCALEAVLHGVGAGERARGHDLVELAARCRDVAGMVVDDDVVGALRTLSLQYLPSRYPDAVPGDATPSQAFGAAQSTAAVRTAAAVVAAGVAAWRQLLAAARDHEEDEG